MTCNNEFQDIVVPQALEEWFSRPNMSQPVTPLLELLLEAASPDQVLRLDEIYNPPPLVEETEDSDFFVD